MMGQFRVWNTQLKQWVDKSVCYLSADGTLMFLQDGRLVSATPHYVKSFSTNLHDKNGKEIWEGDVVGSGYQNREKGFVIFENAQFKAEKIKPFEGNSYFQHPDAYEVLGNIYENPELMTTKLMEGEEK